MAREGREKKLAKGVRRGGGGGKGAENQQNLCLVKGVLVPATKKNEGDGRCQGASGGKSNTQKNTIRSPLRENTHHNLAEEEEGLKGP